MRLLPSLLLGFVGSSSLFLTVRADFNEAYVCSFCTIVLGLVEEAALQADLEVYLNSKCDEKFDKKIEKNACEKEVENLVAGLEENMKPDDICKNLDLCKNEECTLYTQWPVPLPPAPEDWPTQRRRTLYEELEGNSLLGKKKHLPYVHGLFERIAGRIEKPSHSLHSVTSIFASVAKVLHHLRQIRDNGGIISDFSNDDVNGCGHNVTCHAMSVATHQPLQDHDGDYFAIADAKTLRGNDWRGVDCDDRSDVVYPGRKTNSHDDSSVDHDCNGISGSNSSGSYDDLFCSLYPGRSLIMLGDSATAHFHLPPQWLTAENWHIDNFVGVAENEIDFPMCSWGTGHVDPELCPFQDEVPGVTGVSSLYLKMRERNRCNNNDFQNVGVNGARITSSSGLVDAIKRDPVNDKPVLLWISLIGNDVCNGHPGFDHMTTPEDFYNNAMNTLSRLDTMLPSGSHVVALALFDGELLFDTMHAQQHPIGSSYSDFYDFMNCYEESPCWGWLNSNNTDRQLTTERSNELNRVWRDISETETFENFKFIFYAPVWPEIFQSYATSGLPVTNLIEKSDGFHPSQAGNALFAETFFAWLEENHPDAIGEVNPHNDEIDAIFFSGGNIDSDRRSKVENMGKDSNHLRNRKVV